MTATRSSNSDGQDDYLALLNRAEELSALMEGLGKAPWLRDAVIGPLRLLLASHASTGKTSDDGDPASSRASDDIQTAMVTLALDLARACASGRHSSLLIQAAASAADIAWQTATDLGRDDLLQQLGVDETGVQPATIRVMGGGPLVLERVPAVNDHLGQPLPTRSMTALCRCGQSSMKPTCDGACRRDGFDDAKDPNRVPNRRDRYVGQQVEVLDNRGTCQHSGLCTDKLSTAFRTDKEPFVAPSGGRMDEIIRAVRDCPSGALSYALDGVEARSQVDYNGNRPPAVLITRDGPYRVTGGIHLVADDGTNVDRNDGASEEHFALCRCGHSQNKPFCSGMHWHVGFKDPLPDADTTPTVFEWAGGMPAFERLTRVFYEKYVPEDPLLAPLFANMSADHPQRVAKWLSEVFGGPKRYSEEYGGYTRMLSEHVGRGLTDEQRSRWVQLLLASAHDVNLPNDAEFRSVFSSYVEWGSRLAVENSQTKARPPEHMPMPRWDWNTSAGSPAGRASALTPATPESEVNVALPAADEVVRFEKHIKPLFHARDRESMLFAFDLWKADDVRMHSSAILDRLRQGTMPCYGTWPTDWIGVLEKWIATGMNA